MQSFELQIGSMHCNGCALRLEQMLKRVSGVSAVKVSYQDGQARLIIDPDATSPEKLVALVTDAGFTAKTTLEGRRHDEHRT
ncbi:hypothetical protein BI364_13620 [Acidihalobacter yilgarnensis]|uniref:HMA domain-containing protein n=1 Tax=Acidihalobacter yilgarnensis TaxID=2819280 RepID=A0A1D8IQP6_9GAMM|nr:heavy metal-associated domain-containing protein [Acidihalobacter yilgarnensis]AOU98858.1 hypothetical protein BI364_13620 [Acidihalobacter yilgarnensis]